MDKSEFTEFMATLSNCFPKVGERLTENLELKKMWFFSLKSVELCEARWALQQIMSGKEKKPYPDDWAIDLRNIVARKRLDEAPKNYTPTDGKRFKCRLCGDFGMVMVFSAEAMRRMLDGTWPDFRKRDRLTPRVGVCENKWIRSILEWTVQSQRVNHPSVTLLTCDFCAA